MRAALMPLLLALAVLSVLSGCDKGLHPLASESSGISGVISFKNWPAIDSVKELRLVIFSKYPADSSGILVALLTGTAVIYPPIGATGFTKMQDTLHYEVTTTGTTLKVEKYDYMVLAWRYGNNFFADWRPAGVYTLDPVSFTPAPVRVLLHKVTPGYDIVCDFHNLPPKPWR